MSGYSAREPIPPGTPMPTQSGVPRLPPMPYTLEQQQIREAIDALEAQIQSQIERCSQSLEESVSQVETQRQALAKKLEKLEMVVRPPKPPRILQPPITREALIERHCLAEARREVASWWSAELYVWREFELDPLDLVQPLEYSRLVR